MDPFHLDAAVEALRRDPSRPVVASVDGLTIELRALRASGDTVATETAEAKRPRALGEGEPSAADIVRAIGTWSGGSLDELLADLSEIRRQGGSRTVPSL